MRGLPEISGVFAERDAEWRQHANCRGMNAELFFQDRGESTAEAKAVCRGCVVRDECLEFALVSGVKFGVWGGASELERRRLRRRRLRAVAS